ncbi:MAG: 50S ribosomal protein L30 [Candidatus Polarisedimenticolia bacterium]
MSPARRTRKDSAGGRLKVRQVRSGIGFERNQKETLRSLGLRRLNQVVDLPDNPAVRGMIQTVCHLVEIV